MVNLLGFLPECYDVYVGEGAENGLEFTIVRPFNWIGPRMDFIPGIDGPSEGVPRVLACFSNVSRVIVFIINLCVQKLEVDVFVWVIIDVELMMFLPESLEGRTFETSGWWYLPANICVH